MPEFAAEKELYIINGIGMVLNMFAITWLYNALEQYAYITVCNMVVKLLSLVLMFLLVHNPEDYIVYGGITVFASSASYVFNFVYATKFVSFKKSGTYDFRIHIKADFAFFCNGSRNQCLYESRCCNASVHAGEYRSWIL